MSLERLKTEVEKIGTQNGWDWNTWKEKTYNGGGTTLTTDKNGLDVLVETLSQRIEDTGGLWRSRITGSAVVDLEPLVLAEVKARKATDRALVKNFKTNTGYVSPFKPRSAEQAMKDGKRVAAVLSKHFQNEGYVFQSKGVEQKIIDLVSKHFVAGDSEDGIRFHKVDGNGLLSTVNFSIEEIGRQLGFSRLIDSERSELNKMAINANIRAAAERLAGKPNLSHPKGAETYEKHVSGLMDRLRAIDKPRAGHLVRVNEARLKSEFVKERSLEIGFTPGGADQHSLEKERMVLRNAEHRIAELNSLANLSPLFNEIQVPTPTVQAI